MVTRRDIIYISVLIIVLMLFFYIYTKSRYRNVVTVNSRVLRLIKEDNSTSYVKILWMYWEQGIENLHKYHQGAYNKMCFDGWKKLNPDWDIRILNKTTALNYVPELAKFNHLSRAMRSDLLRIKLLERYGGVWADASTLPMKPLTGWVENCDAKTGIFFYRYFPSTFSRLYNPFVSYISSWFIVAKRPNHYVIQHLAQEFQRRVATRTIHTLLRYFYFHQTLTYLINDNELIKTYISALTSSQELSHSILLGKPHPPLDKTRIADHPLCYKRALSVNQQDYYDYINTY